jgi:hypothetical protein
MPRKKAESEPGSFELKIEPAENGWIITSGGVRYVAGTVAQAYDLALEPLREWRLDAEAAGTLTYAEAAG